MAAKFSFFGIALVLPGSFLGVASAALAQEGDNAKPTVVERLVVTAERRTQDLQKTAISATVLDEEALKNKSVTGLTSLQYAAPGIQISDYSSANTFNIRGVGQSDVGIDLPSGVVIYRDGVPTLTGYFQNAPYYDMAGVEVLRGPQGTFVGKSASAGAVFIRTKDPELGDSFSGSLMAGIGNHNFFETTAVANQPIGEDAAIRLAYHYEKRESLFDSIQTNPLPGGAGWGGPFFGDDHRDLDSIRLGFKWQVTEALEAIIKFDYDDLYFGTHVTSGLDPLTGELQDVSNPIANGGPHYYKDYGHRFSAQLNYTFDDGIILKSLTGWSNVDTTADWEGNGANPAPSGFMSHGDFTNVSQEFDLISPEDQRLRWVIGAFLQDYLNDVPDWDHGLGLTFWTTNGATVPTFQTPWKRDELNYAFFGHVAYDLADQLELEVGARWSQFEFDQFTEWTLPIFGDIPFIDPAGGVTNRFEEDSFDWTINVNYQLNEDHFIYGLVSRGHTPGAINAVFNPFDPAHHTAFKEMSVINYEAGWKGEFFESQLRTQAAAYYQTFEDYQAPFSIPGILNISDFKNAQATSTIWGIELGAQAAFGNWTWDAGFAYSKSELGSFGFVNNPFAAFYGGPATVELDGARTPFAPEVTANTGISYTVHFPGQAFGEDVTMTPRVDVSYRSDSYAALFINRATLLEHQTLANAQLRFNFGADWDLDFWATNLTDERFAAAKQNVAAVAGTPPTIAGIVYMAPPRLIGVRVTRSF